MSRIPATTTKIPAEMHERLLRAAKSTGLSKAALLRLCVDIGVPHLERKFDEMRGKAGGVDGVGEDAVGVSLAASPQQLTEMRELYRSAVTDLVPGVSGLAGEDFVRAVEKALKNATFKPGDAKRIRRFLTIYAQLF